jgi:protease I
MAKDTLHGLRVAILVTDGFEQVELLEPRSALDDAGADTSVVSPKRDRVRGWNFTEWGDELPVDVPLARAQPQDFDALLLPGGVMNPDTLRMQPAAVEFVKAFFDGDKPVAVICHGPWTVIEAGAARGRRIASWPSLKTDLRNAGAEWVDQEVVVDRNLVSSRKPDDIPAFNRETIRLFSQALVQARRRREAGLHRRSDQRRRRASCWCPAPRRPGRASEEDDGHGGEIASRRICPCQRAERAQVRL